MAKLGFAGNGLRTRRFGRLRLRIGRHAAAWPAAWAVPAACCGGGCCAAEAEAALLCLRFISSIVCLSMSGLLSGLGVTFGFCIWRSASGIRSREIWSLCCLIRVKGSIDLSALLKMYLGIQYRPKSRRMWTSTAHRTPSRRRAQRRSSSSSLIISSSSWCRSLPSASRVRELSAIGGFIPSVFTRIDFRGSRSRAEKSSPGFEPGDGGFLRRAARCGLVLRLVPSVGVWLGAFWLALRWWAFSAMEPPKAHVPCCRLRSRILPVYSLISGKTLLQEAPVSSCCHAPRTMVLIELTQDRAEGDSV